MAAAGYPSDIIDIRGIVHVTDTRGSIDVFHPAPFGIAEILEANLLFSCWSRPTITSGIPSDITDTRGTTDVFHPVPSGVVDILDAFETSLGPSAHHPAPRVRRVPQTPLHRLFLPCQYYCNRALA